MSLLMSPLCRYVIECFACEILMVGIFAIFSYSPDFFLDGSNLVVEANLSACVGDMSEVRSGCMV